MLSTTHPLALPLERLPRIANRMNNALFTFLPKLGKTTFAFLPFSMQQKALLTALSHIFKEELEDGDFDFLTDRWLKITINDLGLTWLISYKNDELIMAEKHQHVEADVTFSANGDDLLLIASRKEDPDTLFFQRRLVIEGDTELGLEVKNLIDAIDIEQLPSIFNQVIQHCATWVETMKQTSA